MFFEFVLSKYLTSLLALIYILLLLMF